jgi:hypothetical protein
LARARPRLPNPAPRHGGPHVRPAGVLPPRRKPTRTDGPSFPRARPLPSVPARRIRPLQNQKPACLLAPVPMSVASVAALRTAAGSGRAAQQVGLNGGCPQSLPSPHHS